MATSSATRLRARCGGARGREYDLAVFPWSPQAASLVLAHRAFHHALKQSLADLQAEHEIGELTVATTDARDREPRGFAVSHVSKYADAPGFTVLARR